MSEAKRRLRPVLDGEFWMVGDNPDLGELQGDRQECVDHHIFRSDDGAWHLWGCIRGTAIGRLLYHWEDDALTDEHWRRTGEFIRADTACGECIDDWNGDEWLQSPFIVREGGMFYMFYGGHSTGRREEDAPVDAGLTGTECQICLMTSPDGRHWMRRRDDDGYSRVFTGPGETRDPCLIEINGLYYMYYAGSHNSPSPGVGYYLRTSDDLINWSDWQVVHMDPGYGAGRTDTECPHVVERGGYYYLFRTVNYPDAVTHVFRSKDPRDFGVGDARDKHVCRISVGAPEIIVDPEGNEYITSNHDLNGGTRLCRLKWVED